MRKLLSALFVVCGGVLGFGLAGDGGGGGQQPLLFNHKLHTQDLEIECVQCHRYVETSEFAGRPKSAYCKECHEEALTDSPEEKKLLAFMSSGGEIPWKRLYRVPEHVYFSHRRHVTVSQIECEVCHGDMALRTSPPGGPLVRLSMDFCMDCHEAQNASVDCNSCHR